MQFERLPKCDHSFGKPEGSTDAQVGRLWVQRFESAEMGCMGSRSFWRPEPDEIAAILAGGFITLEVYGGGHPVVSMGVSVEEGAVPVETPQTELLVKALAMLNLALYAENGYAYSKLDREGRLDVDPDLEALLEPAS